ncbi:MAG: TetR/AcrR family transcriptional regulator [Proteobacteria bacterium]|nr:TetR/AcrR family transcriptional regulator [Pseudomonadota bacterium]
MAATVKLDQNERRTQAERTALSDQRMLDAAVALICERGAAGTTLKEVGERAGYSRGLASYRFRSKGGLSAFIIRSIGESWLRELRRVVKDKVGVDAIAAATDAHFRFIVEGSDHIRAFYMLWFDSIGPTRKSNRWWPTSTNGAAATSRPGSRPASTPATSRPMSISPVPPSSSAPPSSASSTSGW